MHPFGERGSCGTGLFRAPFLEPLMPQLKMGTLARSWNSQIVGVMLDQMGAKLGYRVLYDDMILKSILAAQIKSDKGEVWSNFGVTPKRSRLKTVCEPFASSSPFVDCPCHGPHEAHNDDDPFTRLGSMIGSGNNKQDARPDFSKLGQLTRAYELTLNQIDAVGWYSSPQAGWRGGEVPATEDDAPGQRYVASDLTQAMRRLPSLRDLGVQLVTFRIVGGDAPSVAHLKEGTIIYHGVRRMKNGSHHFMSTSITPNVKGFTENVKKRAEVLAICGGSGRYIQWLGRHSGSLDGDEVLYPPGTVTRFYGRVVDLDIGGLAVPLYLLVECDPTDSAPAIVDDFKFTEPKGADKLADVRKAYATTGRILGDEVID